MSASTRPAQLPIVVKRKNRCQVAWRRIGPGRGSWQLNSGAPQPVLGDLPTERIAVHSEQIGGLTQVAVGFGQDVADKLLLELPLRVFVAHAPRDHFIDEALELLLDRHYGSSCPVMRRYASRYFSRVLSTTESGSEGTGGCLFQRISSR